MWLYYCKLRGANDFESVNQLIVADKMFEMLDSETATHIGVLQGEEWYNPRDLGKQCDIFYASKGKFYDEPERAEWNDSERRSFNDKHFKRDCPKNKEVDNKRLNENKVSTEGTELVDGTVAARVDVLGKVIPRRAIEDKLSKLVKTSISVDWKLVHALVDSGTEITVIKKDLVPRISVEGASTIYLKGIFGPAVKCPLVYVPIGLATGGQVNVVHQQVLCALAEVLVEDVLLPPDVLDMLGGAQSEENSLAQSSQDLRVDSGNVDETEVSSGILPEKAQEHIEDSQRNITSCRNEVGTLGTKDEEVTAEMDKGIMVADSFRSEQECCAELALVWKYAKEGKGNYYEVDGYLFRRDKILGECIGQLVIPKCRRTEVLKLAHTSVFSSHMGPKKTLERIKYSFFWEGLRADVKKFCESCKECQLTRSVRIKDRSSSTPVARPELPFEVGNMDLIGPIDPPSLKGHKYILRLVDQHTRWGEAVPLTSLSAKVTCEAWLNIFSRTEIYLLSKREGFVEKNSAASWVTVLDLWKWYFCRSLTKNYAACFMSFGICMTKKPGPNTINNYSTHAAYPVKWLVTLTAENVGPGFEFRRRHGLILGEGEKRPETSDLPRGFLPLNWDGTELNLIVNCMVLKAKPNDKRTSSFCQGKSTTRSVIAHQTEKEWISANEKKADKECHKHRLRAQQSNMQPDLRKLICEHIIRVLQHQKDINQKNSTSHGKHDFVSLVYVDKPQTLDHLEDDIHRDIADIRPQMLEKVIENHRFPRGGACDVLGGRNENE
ncbi:retrovirus-related Pol polyprotein from transposon opus [Trichonephila clavipes]|nr:retrovirus-related Pol polyprotein from transposon opus [Trichonephila clavipes]